MNKNTFIWSIASILILICFSLSYLYYLGSKYAPAEVGKPDSWYKPVTNSGSWNNWHPVQYEDVSPVKDKMDAISQKMLIKQSFYLLKNQQAQAMALKNLKFSSKKKAFLLCGVFYSYSTLDPMRGFFVQTAQKRVWISQHALGGPPYKMRRKAVIVLLNFVPSASYCTTGVTR